MIGRLTVLGPGTILPLPGYGCSGYILHWVPAGENTDASSAAGQSAVNEVPILMDCGPGTLDRLYAQGTLPEQIDLVLISHFHVDHVSDLGALFLARWLRNLGKGGDPHCMTIVGPPGMKTHLEKVAELNQPWISEYTFEVVELDEGGYEPPSVQYKGLSLHTAHTGHTEESICYRVQDERGRVLFYSGDTDYNETLIPLAREADLAVIECSMPDEKKLPGHLTPRLSGKMASRAGVKRLLLTHFYPEVLAVDIAAEVATEFSGRVELARTFQSYEIG